MGNYSEATIHDMMEKFAVIKNVPPTIFTPEKFRQMEKCETLYNILIVHRGSNNSNLRQEIINDFGDSMKELLS